MIQLNLLPDVKHLYMRARRIKRLVILSALTVTGVMIGIFIILFLVVNVVQRRHLANLTNDIQAGTKEIQNTPELNKILTVQNQLRSLPDLHAKKPVTTRLYDYIAKVVPAKVTLAKFDIDFAAQTMTFSGAADTIQTVNQFVDTLKFTQYKAGGNDNKSPFTEVVLGQFGRDDKKANFLVKLKFDPLIFDSATDISLIVPKIITTRSITEKPVDLFRAPTGDQQKGVQP